MFLRRKPTANLTDEDLVTKLRAGDRSSLAALWDLYAQLLFGVCMKYTKDVEHSKDLVLELFESLPALLAKHEVKSFRPWVHTVMRNRCLMALRKHDPAVRTDEATLAEVDPANEEATLREATLQQLEAGITRLNDAQRLCITLFYFERNSYQQVAERSGFPVDQVRSHLQNGRRNLRLMLEHHGDQTTH